MSLLSRGLAQLSLWAEADGGADGQTDSEGREATALSAPQSIRPSDHLAVRPSGRLTTRPPTLESRLRSLGLPRFERITTHRNRTVMVSFLGSRILRVHEGYSKAPDEVLGAIVQFVSPGTRAQARREARRALLAFPLEDENNPPPPRRPVAPRPEDAPVVERLRRMHAELNQLHFGGRLKPIEIRLSNRMRRRLGEVRLDRQSGAAMEISLSRRHLRRDGWGDARQTLLHEMVHQWQAESGLPVDHGAEFRRKAREVGIEPRAVRGGG